MNKYPEYIEKILSLSNDSIIKHHELIKDKTYVNIHCKDSRRCGTIANAIFNYVKVGNNIRNYTSINRLISNIYNDNNNNKLVYNIGLQDSETIYSEFNHAFCIIKLNSNRYYILQGYFKNYTLKESKKRVKIIYNKKELIKILLELAKFIEEGEFDYNFVQTWDKLAGVDISLMISNKQINRCISINILSCRARSKL